MIFNGEIYNFKYIRKVLIEKGLFILPSSDTEVLIKGIPFFGATRFVHI